MLLLQRKYNDHPCIYSIQKGINSACVFFKKLKEEAAEFSLVQLEQLVVPLDPMGNIKGCEASIELKLPDSWGPSFKDDEHWHPSDSMMTEVSRNLLQHVNCI